MNKYLCLADSGFVVAVFAEVGHALAFCKAQALCMMEFNVNNRDKEPAPQAGDTYKA